MLTATLAALFVCVWLWASGGRQGPQAPFMKGLFCGVAVSAVLVSLRSQ